MATGTQLEKSAPLMHGNPVDRPAGRSLGRARVGWAGMQPAQRGWMLVAALLLRRWLEACSGMVCGPTGASFMRIWTGGCAPGWPVLSQAQIPLSPLPTVPASWCCRATGQGALLTAAKGLKSGRLGLNLRQTQLGGSSLTSRSTISGRWKANWSTPLARSPTSNRRASIW